MTPTTSSAPTEPVIVAARHDDRMARLELHMPGALLYFRGHFPGYPVLPGIVQTHWAVTCARRYFGVATEVGGVQVKFKRVIVPEARLNLDLDYARERQRLSFAYHDADGPYSSGVITFGDA